MFPDQTKPRFSAYRLQLPPGGHWTEWRPIEIPILEPYILSLELNELVTKEQYAEFAKQIEVGHAGS